MSITALGAKTGLLTDVLKNGHYDKLTAYISIETYIQHNPQIGDGLDGLGSFVESLTEQRLSMVYEEIPPASELANGGKF